MRLMVIPSLAVLLCLASCIQTTIACGVTALDLRASDPPKGEWQLVHVNPDGSAVLSYAGSEREFGPPDTISAGRPSVVASNYELQTATIGAGFSERTYRWVWWPW